MKKQNKSILFVPVLVFGSLLTKLCMWWILLVLRWALVRVLFTVLYRPVTDNNSSSFSCVRTNTVQSRQTDLCSLPPVENLFFIWTIVKFMGLINVFRNVYHVLVILDGNRERMQSDEPFVNRSSSHVRRRGTFLKHHINMCFGHSFPSFFRVKFQSEKGDLIFAMGNVVCTLLIVNICLRAFVLQKQNTAQDLAKRGNKNSAPFN